MKKLITILIIATLVSCSNDDECTCRGEYFFIDGENSGTFFAENVDCDTGDRDGVPIQSNASFLGCVD